MADNEKKITETDELDYIFEVEIFGEEETSEKSPFNISDDVTADWAIRKIKDKLENLDRLEALGKAQKAEIDAKIERERKIVENGTAFLRGKLLSYFESVPHESTKTEEKYKLLSGTLKMKKASKKYDHNDDELTKWLIDNGYEDFIKRKAEPRWGELKKMLEMTPAGVVILKASGEVVDGVTIVETPPEFDIKF